MGVGAALLVLVALGLGFVGFTMLTNATLGVGIVGLGCLFAILARIAQAAAYNAAGQVAPTAQSEHV